MNRDNLEGAARKTIGQVEEFGGRALKDKQTAAEGVYDQAMGTAQDALGHAKDAVANGVASVTKAAKSAVDEVANTDFGALRDDVAKLSQTVSQLVQNQASAARTQVMDVVGAAGDNISQTAAAAQDKLALVESDLETRIQRNPWGAVALAVGVGVLIGKMS